MSATKPRPKTYKEYMDGRARSNYGVKPVPTANREDAYAEGFRRGVQAAADLVSARWTARTHAGIHIVYTFPRDIADDIRALRPEGEK